MNGNCKLGTLKSARRSPFINMANYEFVSVDGPSYSILCIDFQQIEQNFRKQAMGLEAKARKYNGNDGSLTRNFQVNYRQKTGEERTLFALTA